MEPKKFKECHENFKRNGQKKTLREFCRESRINYSLFSKWIKEQESVLNITPIQFTRELNIPASDPSLESVRIKLNGGVEFVLQSVKLSVVCQLAEKLSY